MQRGWFEWGPDEIKQHKRQIMLKNGTTKYNKSEEGSVRLGSKVPF